METKVNKDTLLKVEDLHTFYGKSHVLFGINLSVNRGETVCLLGRNGAGKTTTLKSIMGIILPHYGRVLFKGRDISKELPHVRCKLGMGFVPEDRQIFPSLTVLENLQVASVSTKTRSSEKRAGKIWLISDVFDSFPKLKELEKAKGMDLSGGEKQMLTIARSLLVNPELLLLDEPSEGLAPLIVQNLGRTIKAIQGEVGILLSEQNAKFALKLSNRGYMMSNGKITFQDEAVNLVKNEEVREKYLAV